jgi:hypothetical protein
MLSINSLIIQKVLNNQCVCSFELYPEYEPWTFWVVWTLCYGSSPKILDYVEFGRWVLGWERLQHFLSCVLFVLFFLSPHCTLHAFSCAWARLMFRTEISALWNGSLKICSSQQLLYIWVVTRNSFNFIGPLLTKRVAGGVDIQLLECMVVCFCLAVFCSVQIIEFLLGLICIPVSLGCRNSETTV